jgi:hypothetical protein
VPNPSPLATVVACRSKRDHCKHSLIVAELLPTNETPAPAASSKPDGNGRRPVLDGVAHLSRFNIFGLVQACDHEQVLSARSAHHGSTCGRERGTYVCLGWRNGRRCGLEIRATPRSHAVPPCTAPAKTLSQVRQFDLDFDEGRR